jgi:hypothetical protein
MMIMAPGAAALSETLSRKLCPEGCGGAWPMTSCGTGSFERSGAMLVRNGSSEAWGPGLGDPTGTEGPAFPLAVDIQDVGTLPTTNSATTAATAAAPAIRIIMPAPERDRASGQ